VGTPARRDRNNEWEKKNNQKSLLVKKEKVDRTQKQKT